MRGCDAVTSVLARLPLPLQAAGVMHIRRRRKTQRLGDGAQLAELSKSVSSCFRHLEEVCQAQLDRISADPRQRRPEKLILELLAKGITDFDTLFSQFSEQEGIYGFGDLQVRELFDYLVSAKKTLT